MIKTILFDLDGTLLPMDEEKFLHLYFKHLKTRLENNGHPTSLIMAAVQTGIKAMVLNDGSLTNEDCFWGSFEKVTGLGKSALESTFIQYYENEFDFVRPSTQVNPRSAEIIKICKDKGYQLVLATNPIFPSMATKKRVRWAELNFLDFDWITTYENSRYCKPGVKYFEEILKNLGRKPEECLMIGNDAQEDMISEQIGVTGFLLTDCLINRNNTDISAFKNGSTSELRDFLLKMPNIYNKQ
jgi:FMN phosphatase YigB (HAD superfamily)